MVEIEADAECVVVREVGEFALPLAKQDFLAVREAIIKYRSTRVLFDCRAFTKQIPPMEQFAYYAFAAQSVITDSPARNLTCIARFAYVFQTATFDPQKFGETVAVNRGMNTRVFANVTDAYQWLEILTDKPADPHIMAKYITVYSFSAFNCGKS